MLIFSLIVIGMALCGKLILDLVVRWYVVWLIFSVGVIFVVLFVGVRFAGVVFVRTSMLVNVVKGDMLEVGCFL